MHKQLNYWQFTLYWVDTLSYEVLIKVLYNLITRYLLCFIYNPLLRRLNVSFSSRLC